MPFPQYVASFSKRTLVSGSVRGRMLSCMIYNVMEADLKLRVWVVGAKSQSSKKNVEREKQLVSARRRGTPKFLNCLR